MKIVFNLDVKPARFGNITLIWLKSHEKSTDNKRMIMKKMPRNYIRKTEKNSWDPENLKKVLEEIRYGKKIREAGQAFNIPESTL
ncbi:unnamed protein product [Acanthoscelides obtectus]|uniref:HTH psq-type domain-containing protein n=1 Tax=Acanthoscelides obtectus TaxID=200917 RepID=A0A9P0M7A3_ACAOB|nr:unnamed protein product [Acanthoscelides obtectus]CAK1631806.1 hypothetical protein AOBTE_LOCUS7173 [Acanthoscelides obtectus]